MAMVSPWNSLEKLYGIFVGLSILDILKLWNFTYGVSIVKCYKVED